MNRNQAVGQFGEKVAAKYLVGKGYEIKGRNIKTGYKEIDIIATINNSLIIVEVKTRTNSKLGTAEDMMSPDKIKNLKQAVFSYLENINGYFSDIRFDFMAVDIDIVNKTAKIKHFKDIV